VADPVIASPAARLDPTLASARPSQRLLIECCDDRWNPPSLAAGMSIFTLSRRMGTSVQMIDATYGHLAHDADDYDRGLLDAYDEAQPPLGT
jgi:hypothetical protein